MSNKRLILVKGESTTGKSASLENIPNQKRWLYLNTEAGKDLPFPNQFYEVKVTDPFQVTDQLEKVANGSFTPDGVIIDSLTFLMDLFESTNIYKAKNGMQAWSDFQQYFKYIIQQLVPKITVPVILTAHSRAEDVGLPTERHVVPVKGALKDTIEAYFSLIVMTRLMPISKLEPYAENGILNITEDERDLGFKHVFQTHPTEETIHDRIRGPKGLFNSKTAYMDNDVNSLLEFFNNYYNGDK